MSLKKKLLKYVCKTKTGKFSPCVGVYRGGAKGNIKYPALGSPQPVQLTLKWSLMYAELDNCQCSICFRSFYFLFQGWRNTTKAHAYHLKDKKNPLRFYLHKWRGEISNFDVSYSQRIEKIYFKYA